MKIIHQWGHFGFWRTRFTQYKILVKILSSSVKVAMLFTRNPHWVTLNSWLQSLILLIYFAFHCATCTDILTWFLLYVHDFYDNPHPLLSPTHRSQICFTLTYSWSKHDIKLNLPLILGFDNLWIQCTWTSVVDLYILGSQVQILILPIFMKSMSHPAT